MSNFPSVAFLTGSVGTGEWIVLFVVVLIVVGPKRLPEIARKIGRTMEMFRRAADEFKDQLMSMDHEPPAASAPPDADGVPAPGATSEGADSGSYNDAYPNMSDYPGNEEQVENWSSDSLSEQLGAETDGDAGGVSETQSHDSPKDKPSEGEA